MSKIQNPKSKIQNEFLPLDARRIDMGKQESAQPVAWFQHIAPELPTASLAPTAFVSAPVRSGEKIASFAGFRDVEEIVREEREQRLIGEAVPPEIVAIRYEAEQTARELVDTAYTQARAIEEEARQKGHQEGYQAGYADGRQTAEQTVEQQAQIDRAMYQEDIATFIAHIETERHRAWIAVEPQVIDLVFELAKHVIKQEVETNREIALSIVRNALRRVADAGTLRIRVNAEDLQTVRGSREELLTLVDNIRHVEIIEDRRVGVGGCIVETDGGNIDARIETQLAEAASLLDIA